jgi:hypothetical protein
MEFALGVVLYLLGSGLVALCLVAIPGPPQEGAPGAQPSAHHHPGAH